MSSNIFCIPVITTRQAMVTIKAKSLEEAIELVKDWESVQVTGMSTKNLDVKINYPLIAEYNPEHSYSKD